MVQAQDLPIYFIIQIYFEFSSDFYCTVTCSASACRRGGSIVGLNRVKDNISFVPVVAMSDERN